MKFEYKQKDNDRLEDLYAKWEIMANRQDLLPTIAFCVKNSEEIAEEYKAITSKINYHSDWWNKQLIDNNFVWISDMGVTLYEIEINNYKINVVIGNFGLSIQVFLQNEILLKFLNITLERPDLFAYCFEQAQTFINDRSKFETTFWN